MATMHPTADTIDDHLAALGRGDRGAFGPLVAFYHDRLVRIAGYRMDQRLSGRLDPADIVQEACLEAFDRLDDFLSQDKMEFFVWLRFLTVQQILIHSRRHLRTQSRDAGREVPIHGRLPGASSADIAKLLIGRQTSPSGAVGRVELKRKLEDALDRMEEIDREVLTMRHMEQLSNRETASALGISVTAASNRYIRAIRRLKSIFGTP